MNEHQIVSAIMVIVLLAAAAACATIKPQPCACKDQLQEMLGDQAEIMKRLDQLETQVALSAATPHDDAACPLPEDRD